MADRQRTHRLVIGIMGPSSCSQAIAALARQVGEEIARRGAVLLCGGGSGVMEAACEGARRAGGLTLGILPGANLYQSPPNAFVDVALFTGVGQARNWINVCASDAVIAIGKGYGALSEIALSVKAGKTTVLLDSWQLEPPPKGEACQAHPCPGTLRYASTPVEAVELALGAVGGGGITG
ncbi:MAG: TIGR00725 family protein [Pseudomonadota bacterium]